VRIGTSAPIDIVQSEATVASRELDIIVAENQVGNAEDVLKGLMGFENPDDWKSRIVPMDALGVTTTTVSLDESIAQALQNRPELRQRQIETQISQINLLSAKNGVLPQLDFSLRYGFAGVGGTQTFFDPTTGLPIASLAGGWDDPLSQILNHQYNNWGALINFSLPLGNTTARANLAQARFGASSAKQNTALTQQAIISDVRNAVRGLDASSKGISAAMKSRELASATWTPSRRSSTTACPPRSTWSRSRTTWPRPRPRSCRRACIYRQAEAVYRTAVAACWKAWACGSGTKSSPRSSTPG